VAAPAAADTPAHSVTATGTSSVQVPQNTAHNNKAIADAVAAARLKAQPDAIARATIEAQKLAASLGWTLGDMTNVAETPTSYGPFFYYGTDGTFGPGVYCGTVRTAIFRKGKNGRRVFTHKYRSRHTCRIPGEVSTSMTVTFAAS
jgi:hypothetical protein